MAKRERDLNVDRELREQIAKLTDAQKRRLLDYARVLGKTLNGPPGRAVLHLAGTMSLDDAKEMLDAIEEGCKQVDPDGW